MNKPDNDSIHVVFSIETKDCKWFNTKEQALKWLHEFNGQGEWEDAPIKFSKDF